jgi:hypothetical protein
MLAKKVFEKKALSGSRGSRQKDVFLSREDFKSGFLF